MITRKIIAGIKRFIKSDDDFIALSKKHKKTIKAFNAFIQSMDNAAIRYYLIDKHYIDIAWLELDDNTIINLDDIYNDYKAYLKDGETVWTLKHYTSD